MGFTWECDGNTFEKKGMIEDSLPEGFTYKITKYTVIERSEIKEEIKFRADFCVSVFDKEEAIIFIEKIATLNGAELRPRTKEISPIWHHTLGIKLAGSSDSLVAYSG